MPSNNKHCCICDKSDNNVKSYNGKLYCKKHYLQMYRHGKILERTIYDSNEIIYYDTYAEIILYNKNGHENGRTKIDLDVVEKSLKYKWKLKNEYCGCTKANIMLHTYITGYTMVDHINQDKLDNRKNNLRQTTKSKNAMNTKMYCTNTSGHKGISWNKNQNIWTASIMLNYKNIFLGNFKDKADAIKARYQAELIYHVQ